MPGVKDAAATIAVKDAAATIAVRDAKSARRFYEGTLGLKVLDDKMPEALVYQSGKSKILVYQSQYAGTNKATAATWGVGDDIENIVQALKAKGVPFEHYDFPEMTRKGDVHVGGGMKAAWFKDPDGNILALVSE
jgi:catechol 2,3-dioxygenase-like lactoylglutathione lyase family enzyme